MTQVYDRRQKAWVPKKPKPGSPKAMLAAIESLRTALEVERHRIATLERRANEAPVASGKLVVRDPRGCPMCARHVRRVGEIVLRRFECLDPVCGTIFEVL